VSDTTQDGFNGVAELLFARENNSCEKLVEKYLAVAVCIIDCVPRRSRSCSGWPLSLLDNAVVARNNQ
jgi:hypothetical protein